MTLIFLQRIYVDKRKEFYEDLAAFSHLLVLVATRKQPVKLP